MKRLFTILLGLSLATNAWLFARHLAPAISGDATATSPVPTAVKASASPDRPLPITSLESGDPAALRTALRDAGADDVTTRAVMEGILRRRHRDRLAALRIERTRSSWWRSGRSVTSDESGLAKELVSEPLRELLGRDPLDVADTESRFAFLPPDKRRRLAEIDLDYAELLARIPPNRMNTQLQSETQEQKLLAQERRKDVLAALTPQERAEYDLRFSGTAVLVSRRAAAMSATEAEFRVLKPLLDRFDEQSKTLPKGDEFVPAYERLQRDTAEELMAVLGRNRATDFIWSGYDSEFRALRRATAAAGLPSSTPARVMEFAVDLGTRAARVHEETTLTVDQKRAALVALQQTARAELAAVLPADAQRHLPADGMRWIEELGKGRYLQPAPTLLSSGGYSINSVSSPPPKKRPESPLMSVLRAR